MNKSVHIIKVVKFKYINYCYLIVDNLTQSALLIDPAWQPEIIKDLIDLHNPNVKGILLTHSHFDHVNLATYFSELYSIPVYISKVEKNAYHFQAQNLQLIESDALLVLDSFNIKCLLTPGHTAGSMCFLIENNLFSGDTLFSEGCGICSDKKITDTELFSSLQKLKSHINDVTKLFPGHCFNCLPGLSLQEVKNYNLYLDVDNLEDFLVIRRQFQHDINKIFEFI